MSTPQSSTIQRLALFGAGLGSPFQALRAPTLTKGPKQTLLSVRAILKFIVGPNYATPA